MDIKTGVLYPRKGRAHGVGHLLLLVCLTVSLLLLGPAPAHAATPLADWSLADYTNELADCVTGSAAPPPDYPGTPLAERTCDVFEVDAYERPTDQDPTGASANYYPYIDITRILIGIGTGARDDGYLHFAIDLFGLDGSNKLPDYYRMELDVDGDFRGDFILEAKSPTNEFGTTWGQTTVVLWKDANNTIGDTQALYSDGPKSQDGYEVEAWKKDGTPTDLAYARISPEDATVVEFAILLDNGVTGNLSNAQIRGWAQKGLQNISDFSYHDEYAQGDPNTVSNAAGSPYPDSPYFPSSNIFELDNSGAVSTYLPPEEPTSVELVSLSAATVDHAVVVAWETASELQNVGFDIFRGAVEARTRSKLNAEMIPSQVPPGSPVGAAYQFVDETIEPGVEYQYWIESVDIYGQVEAYGPVSAGLLTFEIDKNLWEEPVDSTGND